MAARLKTSQRIVNTSLELFNQLGERSVSTNHIATHMEISPGNLYYHFANKQVRYRRFYEQCLRQGQAIYTGFVKAGILDMTPQQIEALTLNAWIILTSWIGFLCTSSENREQLCEQAIRRGIYQLLVLESGFVTDQYRDAVDELIKEFYVPLEQVMDVH